MSILMTLVQTAARFMPDAKRDPLIDSHGYVGKPLDRVDGHLKVTGGARFAAEYALDDMVYAEPVFSTISKGKVRRLDTSVAKRCPGVIAVLTPHDMPRLKAPTLVDFSKLDKIAASNLPVFQDDRVYWNGQAVALVVAETHEQAQEAATKVHVEYDIEDSNVSFDANKARATMPKDVLGEPPEIKIGDAEKNLAAAPVRVDAVYRSPYYSHSAIEPHATIAVWEGDDKITVFDSTQFVEGYRNSLAHVFGIKPENIRVLAPFVGGGFGGKAGFWWNTVLAVAAAKIVKRPVKFALSREGVFRIVGGRTIAEQRVAIGATVDGHVQSLIHTGVTATPSHARYAEQCTFPTRHLYATDALHIAQYVVDLDMVANTWMRAPGESIGTFAVESALDELAVELRMDPIDLRRNVEPKRDPTKDNEFSSRHLLEAYERGAAKFGWAARNPQPRSQRDGSWLIGQGVATAYYPVLRLPGAARVRVNADGIATIHTAANEMGMGVATSQLQHAADRLGVPLQCIEFNYGDSEMPSSPMAGGSCQTVSIVASVRAAVEKLHRELLKLEQQDPASPLKRAKYDDIVARDRGLFLASEPSRGATYVDILRRAGKQHVEAEGTSAMPMEMMKYSMASYGAQFCEVRVNDITGEVRIARWLGSFDCGTVLNPKTAMSQLRGGIIMGIGMALTEEVLVDDRSGRIMNASLAEYHVPVNLDVPHIDILFNDIPDPHTPLGAHGIGEIGITGVAAAIANAVYNATGKRIRSLPITLDKLL
ncbi:MAG: dehydrogenase [Bryobacterales bacterium]|nr:dehydrogenase [Bryobacterales bacterium]